MILKIAAAEVALVLAAGILVVALLAFVSVGALLQSAVDWWKKRRPKVEVPVPRKNREITIGDLFLLVVCGVCLSLAATFLLIFWPFLRCWRLLRRKRCPKCGQLFHAEEMTVILERIRFRDDNPVGNEQGAVSVYAEDEEEAAKKALDRAFDSGVFYSSTIYAGDYQVRVLTVNGQPTRDPVTLWTSRPKTTYGDW